MSEHRVTVDWKLRSESFDYESYNREHDWVFEGGTRVAASAAPEFRGQPSCVDPEQAFVAAIASCHMLTFLAIASKKRMLVENYTDDAVGHLEKNEHGRLAITRVDLAPQVRFAGEKVPSDEELERMHEKSHAACFIANSVKTVISVSVEGKVPDRA